MKILHFITGLSTGGAERAIYNLLQGGMANKYDCHVVSMMDEGTMGQKIKKLGVSVTSLGMRKGIPSFNSINKLRRVVKKEQPDIIQGWMYHGNLAASLARSFALTKPILSWNVRQCLYGLKNEKLTTRQIIRVNRFLSSKVDTLLYNSHLSRKQHEEFGFSGLKSCVIPNGIDVKINYPSDTGRNRVRRELAIPEDAIVVGHVARLHPMKDHPLFLRAAVRLADTFPFLHSVLCGRGVSYENEEVFQLIPLRMRSRFHLLGERSDIPDVMRAMDIFSSSSFSEAFPNVLGEAMANEVPCVATDAGDSKVIVSEYGVIVSPRDEDALVEGLEQLVSMSSVERRQLGRDARKHIVENFALESIVEQYLGMYEDLIKNSSR